MTTSEPPLSPHNSIPNSNINVFVIYEDAKSLVDLGFNVISINPRDNIVIVNDSKNVSKRPEEEE